MTDRGGPPRAGPAERVVVVGAGIAGLAAAFRLHRAGYAVTVLERSAPERVGGRMATVGRGGFAVDLGAPLLARKYHRMHRLIGAAGLSHAVLPAADLVGVVRDGTVLRGRTGTPARLLAGGMLDAVPQRDRRRLLTDFVRLRRVLHPADMSAAARADTGSLAEYVRDRGLRPETLEHFLGPLSSTLTLAEPEDVSAVSPFLFAAFLLRGGGFFTSAVGSGFLPQGLARLLQVTHHAEVTHVEERPDEVVVTWNRPGEPEHVDHVAAAVVAVPPPCLARICPRLPNVQRTVFAATRYAPLIQVTFCLDRRTAESSVLLHAPRSRSPHIASFLLQHNLSPARVGGGRGMITTYLRGVASEHLWDSDDATITGQVLAGTHQLRVLPEAERHTLAVHVDRIPASVVVRHPGAYRELARAAAAAAPTARLQPAGGDLFGHSTTIGSLASGEEAADRILARIRPT